MSLLVMNLPNEKAKEFYDAVCDKNRVAVYPFDFRHCVVKWAHSIEEFELINRRLRVLHRDGTRSITPDNSLCQPGFSKTIAEAEADRASERISAQRGVRVPSQSTFASPHPSESSDTFHPAAQDSISTHHVPPQAPKQEPVPEWSSPSLKDDSRPDNSVKHKFEALPSILQSTNGELEGFETNAAPGQTALD